MAVPRLIDAQTWVEWLNTVTGDWFWSICGCFCLWGVIFLYMKQRYSTGSAFVGASWSVAFIAMFLWFAGLVSQYVVFAFAALSALSLVVPYE